jgi:predicted transcriptional regulator
LSEEVDNRVIRFIERELPKGHFEHTIREISKGTDLSYTGVSKSVERLTTKGLLNFRKRGNDKKFAPYYYLARLRETFMDSGTRKRLKTQTEAINSARRNSNPSSEEGNK